MSSKGEAHASLARAECPTSCRNLTVSHMARSRPPRPWSVGSASISASSRRSSGRGEATVVQQPARGGPRDRRCPGPQGPRVLRPVRLSRDRLPDRGAEQRPAADPRDRPRLAHGPDRPGQPRPRPAQIPGVPLPRLPHRRPLRQRPEEGRGDAFDGLTVQPLGGPCRRGPPPTIELAILSVPADAAQHVADQVVACGILGILNFAPIPLNVPPSVSVVAVDLSVQLEHLAYKVQNTPGRDLPRGLTRIGRSDFPMRDAGC